MLMLRVSMAPKLFTTATPNEDPNIKTGAMLHACVSMPTLNPILPLRSTDDRWSSAKACDSGGDNPLLLIGVRSLVDDS